MVNGCGRSQVCPSTGCRGEDVTRVSEFFNKIPKDIEADSLQERVESLEITIQSFKMDLLEIKTLLSDLSKTKTSKTEISRSKTVS